MRARAPLRVQLHLHCRVPGLELPGWSGGGDAEPPAICARRKQGGPVREGPEDGRIGLEGWEGWDRSGRWSNAKRVERRACVPGAAEESDDLVGAEVRVGIHHQQRAGLKLPSWNGDSGADQRGGEKSPNIDSIEASSTESDLSSPPEDISMD